MCSVMDSRSERSTCLHNFKTTPTPWLTWGNHRLLRCIKLDSAAVDRRRSSRSFETDRVPSSGKRKRDFDSDFDFGVDQRSPNVKLKIKNGGRYIGVDDGDDDGGIEAVREKLTLDLKTAAESMKFSMLNGEHSPPPPKIPATMLPEEVDRPWNLRTRRALCKSPIASAKNGPKIEERKVRASPTKNEIVMKSSFRSRPAVGNGEERREKFSVQLSRKEIEEDYLMLIGEKPPRRPKKRSKTVQKQIDMISPGTWLTEVTPDMYKVDEVLESGKK